MADKKLMVIFSDNADHENIVLGEYPDGISSAAQWIETDIADLKDEEEKGEAEYTISFQWMTQEEIDNLPEAD